MLVDGLRPLWLPTIAQATGTPLGRIPDWVGRGDYYFDSIVGPTAASFVLPPSTTLVDTFASEMSRFSSAAIETSLGISRSKMPKSIAWLVIQTYYAAFYAAHSILRSVGISASNLKQVQCDRADTIAIALGFSAAPLNSTQYRCEYAHGATRLNCSKAAGGGIHEQFWRIFDQFLTQTSNDVLANNSLPNADAQFISVTLIALRNILRRENHSNGNWLSAVRNEVTYTQHHKAWFPFGRTRAECDRLFALQRKWREEPEDINFNSLCVSDMEVFVLTCAFLVSLSNSVVGDMSRRCTSGTSFLKSGPLRLINLAAAA
jgi:hypothetical protein